jgi:hypothetical protein
LNGNLIQGDIIVVLMVYCDKSNSMDVFNYVHNKSKYLKKVSKMKKDVFLHGNNQIMIVPLKPIIITKPTIMNKIMRCFKIADIISINNK